MIKSVVIQCGGRNAEGQAVLEESISVTVELNKIGGMISVGPMDCPFNTGGHGQRCKASHPNQDKVGAGVGCPFSYDYPYASENPNWNMPAELEEVMQELAAV